MFGVWGRVQSARGPVRGKSPHGSGCHHDVGGALPGATAALPGPVQGIQEAGEKTCGMSEETAGGAWVEGEECWDVESWAIGGY